MAMARQLFDSNTCIEVGYLQMWNKQRCRRFSERQYHSHGFVVGQARPPNVLQVGFIVKCWAGQGYPLQWIFRDGDSDDLAGKCGISIIIKLWNAKTIWSYEIVWYKYPMLLAVLSRYHVLSLLLKGENQDIENIARKNVGWKEEVVAWLTIKIAMQMKMIKICRRDVGTRTNSSRSWDGGLHQGRGK